jgi:hypothetical protein
MQMNGKKNEMTALFLTDVLFFRGSRSRVGSRPSCDDVSEVRGRVHGSRSSAPLSGLRAGRLLNVLGQQSSSQIPVVESRQSL